MLCEVIRTANHFQISLAGVRSKEAGKTHWHLNFDEKERKSSVTLEI